MSQLTQRVPVGFRFHPTDEELVGYYLPKKVTARKIDLDLIRDLDLYKLEPWDLQDLCKIGQADARDKQTDYYFFSRKDKKYPTGNRANRATTKGFWKATGRDKPIHTKLQTLIGMRKTLVFYQGRAPHGSKTDWIMHEFRLDDGPGRPAHEDGGWVVCRVFKKNKNLKMKLQERAMVSFEESAQMGLLLGDHHPVGSTDLMFSSCGGGRFAAQYGAGVKQEIINLDKYQSTVGNQAQTCVTSQFNQSQSGHLSLPMISFRSRLEGDDDFLLAVPDQSPVFNHDGEMSSGTSEGRTADPDECGILGLAESSFVDWGAALYQDQAPKQVTPNPDSVLVHLKRQNSDVFSSMDLWTYSQVAQHM